MDIRQYVSNKIRVYRKMRGLTQKELGNKIGVKHNTVSWYENATNEAEQDILFKIANALEISINDLFPPTISSISLTEQETKHLKIYRKLNDNNKKEIDGIIKLKLDNQKSTNKATQNAAG